MPATQQTNTPSPSSVCCLSRGREKKTTPPKISPQELVASGCRVISELGVDAIKTFFTGERFSEIVAAMPVPILALGARKMPRESDALLLAQRAVQAGARGVVFGRNVIQALQPDRFLTALQEVVKEGHSADSVARAYGLT